MYIWRLQIWKQIWTICPSNAINFPLSLLILVCSSIFIWIFTILHTQCFNKFILSVYLMYTIFPWVFTVLYIQRIQIFKQICTIYTTNVHTFPLNFHYFVLSMKSNFSTSLDYLYILCTPSWFGTFIDFPSIFPEFLHSINSNFFTDSNYSRHLPLGDLYKSFIFPSRSLSIIHMVTYLKKKNTKKKKKPFKCNNRTNAKNSLCRK